MKFPLDHFNVSEKQISNLQSSCCRLLDHYIVVCRSSCLVFNQVIKANIEILNTLKYVKNTVVLSK